MHRRCAGPRGERHSCRDRSVPQRPLLLLAAALLASCGGASSPTASSSGSASSTSASCTTPGQCTFVRDALQQYYYWYRELPNPDPASFSSPEAYLDAVRYRTLDSTFSYITSKASSDAFFSEDRKSVV